MPYFKGLSDNRPDGADAVFKLYSLFKNSLFADYSYPVFTDNWQNTGYIKFKDKKIEVILEVIDDETVVGIQVHASIPKNYIDSVYEYGAFNVILGQACSESGVDAVCWFDDIDSLGNLVYSIKLSA